MATTTAVMTEPQSQPDVITPATNNTAPAEKPKAAVPPKQTIPSTSSAEHPFPLLALDRKSEWIQCPHCNAIAKTTCVLDATDSTHAAACGCCCILGVLGVWMPYVFHWGMDATHFCSACKAKVVYRTSSGPVEIQVPGPKVHPDSKAQYAAPQDMQKPMATGPPAPPYTIEPAPAVIQTQPVEKQPVVSPELAVSK